METYGILQELQFRVLNMRSEKKRGKRGLNKRTENEAPSHALTIQLLK